MTLNHISFYYKYKNNNKININTPIPDKTNNPFVLNLGILNFVTKSIEIINNEIA